MLVKCSLDVKSFIVQMNDEIIPMKWLSKDTYVSYKTINNFRSSKHANNLIKTAFIYFILIMREKGMIKVRPYSLME